MRATTKAGEPCPVAATASGLCYLHDDPSRAKEMGRKGGLRNRRVIPDETAEMPPASVSQIASTLFKAIETADLERRLAKLEGKDGH